MAGDPNELSDEVQAMHKSWGLVDALMGGTAAMQAAGEELLPKFPDEDKDSYKCRLESSTLLPAYSETVKNMNGRVFAEPLTLGEDIPAPISEYAQNIDNQGSNLQVWAQGLFKSGLSHGVAYALVDFPPTVDAQGNQIVRTRADEIATGVRPYVVQIKSDQVLGWKSEARNGAEVLTQFRYMESVAEADPENEFIEKRVCQIRVLEPGSWRTFRKVKTSDKKEAWAEYANGKTSLPIIPVVAYYTDRTGFLTGKPPLMELAYLNKKHWQKQSALDNMEITALVPMLALFGLDDDPSFKMTVGSNVATKLPKEGDMKWVEVQGKPIELGQASLDKLEDQMRMAGGKLLQPQQAGSKTATQAEEEADQDLSPLQTMAEQLEDALDQILQLFADWMKIPEGGHVQVNGNFSPDFAPETTLPLLKSMTDSGYLSEQTLFREVQRRGVISGDLDWEEEQQRIADQGPSLGAL